MRRTTIWLTTALAIAAMGFYYNISLAGDGKDGVGGPATLPAACATQQTDAAQAGAQSTPTPAADGDTTIFSRGPKSL